MRTAVFSIVSPNYRSHARVLMDSLQERHPSWERFVLFVGEDGVLQREGEAFTAVSVDTLPLPHRQQFYFRYTLLELNTAVKPWMFEHLFARGYDRVVYIDPDIVVYTALAELDELSSESFITLTPHLTGSIPGDEDHPSERTILQAGTYNLGFLSVQRHSSLQTFLDWWKEKLEYGCVVDTARGLFVDQKWIDLVPGLFAGVTILRHDGYNVAYWNLPQREVVIGGDGARVNGQPLRFFHFSGVDPADRELVSRHDRKKRKEVGDASRLIEEYVAALHRAGFDEFKNERYSLSRFRDGSTLPDAARVAYRQSEELQKKSGDDPFAHPELFTGMRDRRPKARIAARAALTSYRLLSSARPLVALLPRSLRTSMREMLLGRKESSPSPGRPTALRPGLNVIGYSSRETGVGESARLCQLACERASLPSVLFDVERENGFAQSLLHSASIFHVNADQSAIVRNERPDLFDGGAYNIACWHWELPEFPDAWTSAAVPFQEIWAPSSFVQSAVSRKVSIPVTHMPHGISVHHIESCTPQELGVPAGRFTFLFLFDLASVVQRKNPVGAMEAFRRAFEGNDNVALLIKASRAGAHPKEYADLLARVAESRNVFVSSEQLSRARTNGLLAASDAVVSLHRSEGFGLILAEAMWLGKPVVATGWSGNMDFMNSGNSCPVGYELVTLDRDYPPYAAGQQWAEPDLEHAAYYLKRLFDDQQFRAKVGARGQRTIRTEFSPEAAGLRYRRRLAFLGLLER